MIVQLGNNYIITFLYDNKMIELYQSKEWSYWMRNLQNLSSNTISSFLKSMERFWVWSLYYDTQENESLGYYLARYREQLKLGFEIVEKIDLSGQLVSIMIYRTKSMQKSTINKELAGIKSYFFFIEDIDLMRDNRFVNKSYEKRKFENSFLSSVNMKMANTNFELIGKRREFVKSYKIRVKSSKDIKYFPPELFDKLLSLSEPREQLIYLLCGACSARIGQALNLTIYDIDYERKEVWLIDPKSDDKDIYNNSRSKWLKNEYGINIIYDKPHNSPDLQFKYPIPYEFEPLHWINPKYNVMFFSILAKYVNSKKYLPEFARIPKHPFLFVTRSGNRIRSREINSSFKRTIKKLKQFEKLDYDLECFSLHSLRHMFGYISASLYGNSGDDALISWTKNAMGHSSLESTMIYFNMSYEMKKHILETAINNRKDNK